MTSNRIITWQCEVLSAFVTDVHFRTDRSLESPKTRTHSPGPAFLAQTCGRIPTLSAVLKCIIMDIQHTNSSYHPICTTVCVTLSKKSLCNVSYINTGSEFGEMLSSQPMMHNKPSYKWAFKKLYTNISGHSNSIEQYFKSLSIFILINNEFLRILICIYSETDMQINISMYTSWWI